ncbi:unnamed protein product [Heterobilharzia americana]|nr:unnamed protein product [Heterobilharzia americana]
MTWPNILLGVDRSTILRVIHRNINLIASYVNETNKLIGSGLNQNQHLKSSAANTKVEVFDFNLVSRYTVWAEKTLLDNFVLQLTNQNKYPTSDLVALFSEGQLYANDILLSVKVVFLAVKGQFLSSDFRGSVKHQVLRENSCYSYPVQISH